MPAYRRLGFGIALTFSRLCVLVVCFRAGPARAGNEDSFLFGDQATLMGGAVVATTSGTGATWYNPAGLGQNDRGRLELSGTALALRLRRIPELLRVTFPGGSQHQAIQSTQIYIVPNSIAWVRRLTARLSLGLGVFVTEQDLFRFNGEIKRGPGSPGLQLDMKGQLSGTVLRYHAGASIGWQPLRRARRLRIGGSLFVVYEKNNEFRKLFGDAVLSGAYQQNFLQRLVDAEVSRASLEAVFGLQWRVADYWYLGAVIRSPRWTLFESATTDNSTEVVSRGSTVPTTAITRVEHDPLNSTGTGLTMPPRFYIGAARQTPRYEASVEMDVRPPITNKIKAARWAFNGRAGLLLPLNEKNQLGMGLFTDLSGEAPPKVFPDYRVDYFGATVGWKRKSSVDLRASEHVRTLIFSTTVGVRYALGIGESTTIRFDYTDTASNGMVGRVDNERVNVLYHELSLFFATSLEF